MGPSSERLVEPADFPLGSWVVRAARGGPAIATGRTQASAIEAARRDLSREGGRIVVFGVDRTEKRRITVLAAEPAAVAADDAPLTAEDAVAGVGAAFARARGEAFDPDGDGEADGDDALNRLTELGPEGEARSAIRSAKQWLGVLVAVMGLFPAVFAGLMSEDLGGGFLGIFLGTLAWSGGVAIFTFALVLQRGAGSVAGFTLLALVAFWASNALAAAVGGTVVSGGSLPSEPGPTGVLAWVADMATVAFEVFGPLGIILASIIGALVGWRAAELAKALST